MPKNVVIFSDGTGQAGGFRFDEDRSNIYKLYRATRCSPDSTINPREQLAFYDPGLGSQSEGRHLFGKLLRWVYNLVSQATGFGLTANIIDCYAALIRLWEPGDRIFLFGFSRGAYTVRCLAAVIALCGIPRHRKDATALMLDVASSRKLASYAVKHVYQFTSSRPRKDATHRQRFLLATRVLLGHRFREEHGSAAGEKANVYPYFIGVFDTVASLGSFQKSAMFTGLFLASTVFVALGAEYLSYFGAAPIIGPLLGALSFWRVLIGIWVLAGLVALGIYLYTHIKFDFAVPGYSWEENLRTLHLTELWLRFYDYDLNENVGYAKHAISIDENRKDFARVRWGRPGLKATARDEGGNRWFEQVWFAGNHSDIGGSYPENESRLSDIALKWMLDCAKAVPDGLKHEPSLLRLFPHPEGMQHDEVKAGLGLVTKLFGKSWSEACRTLPNDHTIMHRSVYERFDLREVQLYDHLGPYRPETLREHVDFARFYEPGAPFPATSADDPQAVAGAPIPEAPVIASAEGTSKGA